MADLSDLEDQKETHHHLVLYEAALLELTHGNIPCRTLRSVLKIYIVYVQFSVHKLYYKRTDRSPVNVAFDCCPTARQWILIISTYRK